MEISKLYDISILHFFGEVSQLEIKRLQQVLESLRRTHNHKVLIDMTSVDHVHYRVLKHIIDEAAHFRDANGGIKFVHGNNETRSVLQFTGADQVVEDYATISEAMLSFLKPSDYSVGTCQ